MKTSKNVTEGNLVSVSLVFSQLNSPQYDIKGGIAHDGKKRMPVMGVPLKCWFCLEFCKKIFKCYKSIKFIVKLGFLIINCHWNVTWWEMVISSLFWASDLNLLEKEVKGSTKMLKILYGDSFNIFWGNEDLWWPDRKVWKVRSRRFYQYWCEKGLSLPKKTGNDATSLKVLVISVGTT